MPHDRLETVLQATIDRLDEAGTSKREELVINAVIPPQGGYGPRYLLSGHGEKPFLRMNSNNYLGLSMQSEVAAAGEQAVGNFGTGPGAVRFISGTWSPHTELEHRLAAFHGREAAITFSSAYATMMGVLPSLVTDKTAVISDELNHNCIINATRLANPIEKRVYRHLDLAHLASHLDELRETCNRAIVVTDGVFSMRGDHAPLDAIMALAQQWDHAFRENVIVIVDDSHGVGAFGVNGRGTEEVSASGPVDLLIATLGKAFGVNGGYLAASQVVVDYLRETAPFYIYSNPIGAGEAAAAKVAVDFVDSALGKSRLEHLRTMTDRFENGLKALGYEVIGGSHPIVPMMLRETSRTTAMITHLREHGLLATGLSYPVVPQGDEEIRFQISADHTAADIDEALGIVHAFDN